MSIFQDNITSELLIKNVFNISFDETGFAFETVNTLCEYFFFKWVYNNSPEHAAEGVIERIGNLPISLIESYMKEDVRPLRRQIKKFVKHKWSNTNHLSIEGDNIITISIQTEMVRWGDPPEECEFKIVLTRI